MNHHAELAVFSFLQKAMKGETHMADDIREQVASDIKAALEKQFSGPPRDEFKLRMSNIGRPKCQLWFEKNDPEDKTPFPPHFLINMIIGDIVEAVFKGLLRAAGISFTDNEKVTLTLKDGTEINGEFDMRNLNSSRGGPLNCFSKAALTSSATCSRMSSAMCVSPFIAF